MKRFTNKWNQTFNVTIGDIIFFKIDGEQFGRVKDIHFSANKIKVDLGDGIYIMVGLTNCWKEAI